MVGKPANRKALAVGGLAIAVLLALGGGWAMAARREASLLRADPDAPLAADARRAALDAGRRVFVRQCAACHGAAGRGDPGLGAPNLADRDWLYGAGAVGEIEQTVAYGIRSHHPKGWNLAEMPAFAPPVRADLKASPLSPGDVADLVAFLRARRGDPAAPDAATRGQAVFEGRGGCFDCHGGDAAGDPAIGAPNLVDRIWLVGDGSDAAVARVIAHGQAGVMPAFAGRLSAAQLREVALYVHSLSETPR